MKQAIEVNACGTPVKLGPARVEGIITSIEISSEGVQYKVAYWLSGERKEVWVTPFEIFLDAEKPLVVGFKNP